MSPILWLAVAIGIFLLGFAVRFLARVAKVGFAIFGLGVLVGGGSGLALATHVQQPQENEWVRITDNYKSAMEQSNQALAECTSKFSTATVLYEPQAIQFHFAVLDTLHISQPPLFTFTEGSLPHWVIPAKIAPQLVGGPNGFVGASYFYIDGKGQRSGPFTPEILTAAK
jgi:hypothetical protein